MEKRMKPGKAYRYAILIFGWTAEPVVQDFKANC